MAISYFAPLLQKRSWWKFLHGREEAWGTPLESKLAANWYPKISNTEDAVKNYQVSQVWNHYNWGRELRNVEYSNVSA